MLHYVQQLVTNVVCLSLSEQVAFSRCFFRENSCLFLQPETFCVSKYKELRNVEVLRGDKEGCGVGEKMYCSVFHTQNKQL